jgi:hypothetical protein
MMDGVDLILKLNEWKEGRKEWKEEWNGKMKNE